MKKLLIAVILIMMATMAQADCDLLKIEGRQSFAVRPDHISIVTVDARYITLYGRFGQFKIIVPSSNLNQAYLNFITAMKICMKKGK